jgi:hypothetical protein
MKKKGIVGAASCKNFLKPHESAAEKGVKMKKLFFVVGFLVVCAAVPIAGKIIDTNAPNRSVWLNLGLGSGDIEGFSGIHRISMSASMTFKFNRKLFTVRFVNLTRPFSDVMYGNVGDFGVLYGLVFTDPAKKQLVSAGIGLSLTSVNVTTIGIPIEVQLFPLPFLGIYGFANINLEKTFYGWTICLRLLKKYE